MMPQAWTQEAIDSAFDTRDLWLTLSTVIGVTAGGLVAFAIVQREYKSKNYLFADYMIALFIGCVYSAWFLCMLAVYLGIPGTQIDNLLPPSCEASMAVEGRNGWPCCLKRLSEWMARVVSKDGSWHFGEIEPSWVVIVILGVPAVALPVVLTIVARKARLSEEAAEAAKVAVKQKDDLMRGKVDEKSSRK